MGVVHRTAPSCALADLPISLGLLLPQHASLPCLASFLAASEYDSARGFVGGACVGCVRVVAMVVVNKSAPSCALADHPFSLG